MVKNCAGVTPKSTQKRTSKPLFQPGLVVSVINILRRGYCLELMDITSLLIKIYSGNLNIHQKLILGMLYRLITISETFFKVLTIFLSKNLIFYSYFNCILLFFGANESITLETSRSISLWINNKTNPFNLAFVIVLRSQVLTIRKDEDDRSHLQVVIDKVSNSFDLNITYGIMYRSLYCVSSFPGNLYSRSAETRSRKIMVKETQKIFFGVLNWMI